MTDTHERWANLRALLNQTPGRMPFNAILALIKAWPEDEAREQAIGYAEAHLDHWNPMKRQSRLQDLWPMYPIEDPLDYARLAGGITCSPVLLEDPLLPQRLAEHLPHVSALATSLGYDSQIFTKFPRYDQIRHFTCLNQPIGSRTRELLLKDMFPPLLGLDLSGNFISREKVEALFVDNPVVGALELLDIGCNDIDHRAINLLARCLTPQLRELSLSNNPLTTRGIEILLASPNVASLERLSLSRCQLRRLSARTLEDSTQMPQLRTLRLSFNRLQQNDLQALDFQHKAPNLEELSLAGNQLDDNAAGWLASYISTLPELRHLDVSFNRLSFQGCTILAHACLAHPSAPRLEIRQNPGAIHISRQGLLGTLTQKSETPFRTM